MSPGHASLAEGLHILRLSVLFGSTLQTVLGVISTVRAQASTSQRPPRDAHNCIVRQTWPSAPPECVLIPSSALQAVVLVFHDVILRHMQGSWHYKHIVILAMLAGDVFMCLAGPIGAPIGPHHFHTRPTRLLDIPLRIQSPGRCKTRAPE
jgi:hypothetical protein